MKSRGKHIFRACLILLGTVLFCYVAVWLIDQRLNGIFLKWLSSRSWYDLKRTIIAVFIASVFILVLSVTFAAYFYARIKSKRDIRFISKAVNSIMETDSDDLLLPKKYYEIETQLNKIKAVTSKHQQLVQTETQRKNDLITYLAHDLKTPLASVIGYLSLLDEAPDLPAEQRAKYVGITLKKAYRLEELINEFFDITRFNLQSLVLNVGKINLSFMLRQMADEFYPILSPEGKKVVVGAPEELAITGDADKLARVFNNILKNAASYSYADSTIEIHAAEREGSVVISFINKGDPIPARQLNTIFEKFYRLDSSRSSNTGGAGLGLAIAKDIVAAHNGTISAQSDLERTEFTVILPVSNDLK